MQTEKLVITGSAHTCSGCKKEIPAKSRAWKSERPAETYHERCHAGHGGKIAWYRHEGCRIESKKAS